MADFISGVMKDDTHVFDAQSGVPKDSIMKMGDSPTQNVSFSDAADPYTYAVGSSVDPTRTMMDSSSADLNNFFSRPLKICEEAWDTGSALNFNCNPWREYFEHASVEARLENYNLLRCNLHIKVVLNGNGFHYGRAIVAYNPLDHYDDLTVNDVAGDIANIVQYSQMPHVYIDPTTSTGGELILPFFYHTNYLAITQRDFSRLGELFVRTLAPLKHANGATDRVTVSIFAWAEDVQFSGLTSNLYAAQMGDEIDEANSKGFISGPATTVAKVAGALTMIPSIAPFALATQAGAGMLAKMAKSIGYCSPPVTKNPDPLKPTVASQLAVTNVPDGLSKLTVDDKQELTIDPRISGLGPEDTLNINSIASRESYLTNFMWTVAAPPETLLWNAKVDPTTHATSAAGAVFHFPACAMAALPFQYWTGTMKFRFQVTCSAFHKGRLRITYDPNYLVVGGDTYNTNYIQIIDIADKSDFTIEVGNMQEYSLLTHDTPGLDPVDRYYSTSPFQLANVADRPGNGVLSVSVLNELTTPSSVVTNDVVVSVFVSMGDDFEVFVPDNEFQKFSFIESVPAFDPQSGEVTPDGIGMEEFSAPVQTSSDVVGFGMTNHDMLNKVYIGETVSSFRTLLKRYNLHTTLFSKSGAPELYTGYRQNYPYLRGYVSGAVDKEFNNADYNYCNTLLLHWVTMAHSGWRGGIRHKLLPRGIQPTQCTIDGLVERSPIDTYHSQTGGLWLSEVDGRFVTCVGASTTFSIPSGTRGSAYATSLVNPAIEFETPFYSRYRFMPGKASNYTSSLHDELEGWRYAYSLGGTQSEGGIDHHVSVGEDFQTYFFTGLPPMRYEIQPPFPFAS